MWKQLSEEVQKVVAIAAGGLVHVGGRGVSGRTGWIWGEGLVVTLAREAKDGETVPVVLAGGREAVGTVHAFDTRTGLAVLRVPGVSASWATGPVPAVGALVVSVAFPSPQGPEARLEGLRFEGRDTEWARGVTVASYFQTDGQPFPGFTGAAVLDADGHLVGMVTDNRPGNGGFAVSAADVARLVEPLVTSGSPRQAWLGVSTKPAGGQGLALAGVEAGSPAERAGWKAGDLLLSLDGRALKEPGDLIKVLAGLKPEVAVPAKLLRDGQVQELPVSPGGR